MTDWSYGRDEEIIQDLVEDMYDRDRSYCEDGDFTVHFTLDGNPICCDCSEVMSPHSQYTEEQYEEPVGTCYECGAAL